MKNDWNYEQNCMKVGIKITIGNYGTARKPIHHSTFYPLFLMFEAILERI